MKNTTSYILLLRLNGKIISTVYGDYADDNAAINHARHYLRSSAADTACIHRYDDIFSFITKLTKQEAA